MVAVLQRVSKGNVTVGDKSVNEIGMGLVVLLGVFDGDEERETELLANKTVNLRIFNDAAGKMNRSLIEVGGEALVISQFTLCADYRKGRRPNFLRAAKPEKAEQLYMRFVDRIRESGVTVKTGEFGAMMEVELINSGPVTITLDTEVLQKG